MKKLLLVLAVAAAVAVPAASAGGWATVGLSSLPPAGLPANQDWPVDITVLQHGETPLAGVTPIVRIRDDGGKVVKSFTATPTGRTGVYHATSSGSRRRARSRTRSTTASRTTAAPRRTRSSRSRSAQPTTVLPYGWLARRSGARRSTSRQATTLTSAPAADRPEPAPIQLREAA